MVIFNKRKENKNQNGGSAKPGKYLKLALTNSTNNKIKQDNQNISKCMNNFKSQTNKEERFSREVSQMQTDIASVLRKFS